MDNMLYVILTTAAVFISLILIILLLTVRTVKKQKIGLTDYILIIIFLFGIYLYFPLACIKKGYSEGNPELILKAAKVSVNPFEKRLAMYYSAEIYADDIFNQGLKDGNKAVYYLEKALKREYKKYRGETMLLALLYSIKGDYNKTLELNNILHCTKSLSLLNIYIMNNEYEKAVNALDLNFDIPSRKFLAADLYKKIGKDELSLKMYDEAQSAYMKILKEQKNKSEENTYKSIIEKYKSVENYKNHIKKQRQEYKFAD